MSMHDVGQYLAQCRKVAGYSQEAVARALGITSKSVYEWERGTYAPKSEVLAQYIDLVKADPRIVHELLLDRAMSRGHDAGPDARDAAIAALVDELHDADLEDV